MNGLENSPWKTTTVEDEPHSGWSWIPRAIVVLWLGWALIQSMGASHKATVFSAIDLGIHEAGHLLFSSFGQFLCVAGGTLLQLLAPIITAVIFFRQRDRFAICFAAAWLGINLVEVSVYIADARAQALPLVTVGGGEPLHDWHYLLGRLGLLARDKTIAAIVRGTGYVLHGAAVVAGAWIVMGMAMSRPSAAKR